MQTNIRKIRKYPEQYSMFCVFLVNSPLSRMSSGKESKLIKNCGTTMGITA